MKAMKHLLILLLCTFGCTSLAVVALGTSVRTTIKAINIQGSLLPRGLLYF